MYTEQALIKARKQRDPKMIHSFFMTPPFHKGRMLHFLGSEKTKKTKISIKNCKKFSP
jgi:hypothetical protein